MAHNLFVVHDEDSACASQCFAGLRGRSFLHLSGAQREEHSKSSAYADCTLDLEGASMAMDDAANRGEAKAAAGELGRKEWIKYFRNCFLIHSTARIAHFEKDKHSRLYADV